MYFGVTRKSDGDELQWMDGVFPAKRSVLMILIMMMMTMLMVELYYPAMRRAVMILIMMTQGRYFQVEPHNV